jgi:hypothetical protein
MSKLSGIRDVDREILSKLDDQELLNACLIDKYTWNTVCDDAFLRRRLIAKYPEIESYKKKESWKQFFLKAVRYIALMKEKYGYSYSFGDFVTQYNLLKKYIDNKDKLLIKSVKKGELALVIFSLKNKARNVETLIIASENGQYEIVKYLVEHGAKIHTQGDYALRLAARYGHLKTVKYLLENGADIHAKDDLAFRWALENKHLEVAKYLKSKM